MNAEWHSAKRHYRQARQFSVRELLLLTLATSLVLAIGVSSRGSRHFAAFFSLWALAALTPIVGVLIVGRFRLASPRALAIVSIVLYAASLCTPAVGIEFLSSPSMIWGFHAVYFSAWAVVEIVSRLPGSWSLDDAIGACVYLMGDAANIAFLVSVILYFVGTKRSRAFTLCWRASLLGAVLAIAVLTAFLLTGDIKAIYPGYGLWVASFLAIAVAAKQLKPTS